jgi:homospermidine synthase
LIHLIGLFQTFDFDNRHAEIIDAVAKSRQYYNRNVLSFIYRKLLRSLLNKLLASFINSTRCVKCRLDQQRSKTQGIRFDNCSTNRNRARYASSWLGWQDATRRSQN